MKVVLPTDISYKTYYSHSGMSTKKWGSCTWDFLFISIMGRYPVKIKTSEDLKIKEAFKNTLLNLQYILPCIFCRNSFIGFLKELPIEPYLIGRIELMYWLYLIKDKVNNKLIHQENKCFVDEKYKLITLLYNKQISELEFREKLSTTKKDTFLTIKTPDFKTVLDHYEKYRANCNKKAKKCSLPKQ